ncbi:MAG TPA: hypothetical protein VGM92_02980 [Candidatus Kapabacteria bacterium]
MKNFLKSLGLIALVISVTSTVSAQKRSLLATEPQVQEDHADAAMKWLQDFRNPMHEANYDSVTSAGYNQLIQMDNRPAMKSLSSAAWIQVATSQGGNVSGRPSAIAFDPTGPIYLTVTTGGLWKTIDNGKTWTSLSNNWKTLDVGGVAVNAKNPQTVYAGTGISYGTLGGEGDLNGIGVYQSFDGGLNWVLVDSGNTAVTCQIEVNPGDTNYVYRATTLGIRISTNAGATWRIPSNASFSGFTSLVLDPKNPAVLYAAGGGVVKKSMDSGETWQNLSGYPTGQTMSLAMSQSSSDTLYLSTGNGVYQNLSASSSTLALSSDRGATWKTQSSAVKYTGTQAYYDNAIAVNPTRPASVIVGGLDIYSSTNSGAGLNKQTEWTDDPSSSNYTHADIHVLKYNPYTGQLFALTDGGIFHSSTNGLSWVQDMNADLGTMLFVGGDMAVDPSSGKPTCFCAGAQDNGLNAFTPGQDSYYRSIRGGDGGTMFISPKDGQTCYGTYVDATLYCSQNLGATWINGTGFDTQDPDNILGTGIITEGTPFYMIYDVADGDPSVIAACGNKNLFLTTNTGVDGFPQVTNVGSGTTIVGSVTTVHIAKADDQTLYLGTSGKALYFSNDQGQSWTRSTTPSSFAGVPSSITTDANDPTHVFMTVMGATVKSHFYYSLDGGVTWTAPTSNLPALNYQRVAIDQNGIIYVGHDFGVLRSGDTGKTWYPVADGFPMTMVTSLRTRGNYLLASTYGRGMYYIDLTQVPPITSDGVAAATAPTNISISAVYPSVVPSGAPRSTVDYSLQVGEPATLMLYDVLGRQERVLMNQWESTGQHELSADLSGLPSGQHYVVLTAGGMSVTKPIVIQ